MNIFTIKNFGKLIKVQRRDNNWGAECLLGITFDVGGRVWFHLGVQDYFDQEGVKIPRRSGDIDNAFWRLGGPDFSKYGYRGETLEKFIDLYQPKLMDVAAVEVDT